MRKRNSNNFDSSLPVLCIALSLNVRIGRNLLCITLLSFKVILYQYVNDLCFSKTARALTKHNDKDDDIAPI